MFVLDTVAISESERPNINPGLAAWFDSVSWEDLYISSITIAEVWNGILKIPYGRRRRELEAWFDLLRNRFSGRTLAVDTSIALRYAEIQAEAGPLPVLDTLIGATAVVHRMTLVTRNTADLSRTGARIVNPWT